MGGCTACARGHKNSPEVYGVQRGKQEQVYCDSTVFFFLTINAMNLQFCMASRAVKFSPLRGGCLPVGEIKTKNTRYKRTAAAGAFLDLLGFQLDQWGYNKRQRVRACRT